MSIPDTLQLFVVIFGLSALVIFILHRFKIPSIAGFLIAGVILGPYGLGFVQDLHGVELLAEIGVILLLFTIGIEFSISDFLKAKGTILAGILQVFVTIGLFTYITHQSLEKWNEAVFWGFLVALSSTAIVLKILSDRGEVDSFHGRVMVGILIFQDLCLVPMMFLIPVLSGNRLVPTELLFSFLKALTIILLVFLGGRWVVPRMLFLAVRTKSRELFIITIVLLCLGIALITSKFGLSLAIGAFLAGLIISESEYAHQAVSEILPFKELFIGLFFVSVGMLMDVGYTIANFSTAFMFFALIIAVKTSVVTVVTLLQKYPFKTALHVGLGLAQIGEFSFVMAGVGRSEGLISLEGYQLFLSSSVLSMLTAPFFLMIAPKLSEWMGKKVQKIETFQSSDVGSEFIAKKENHVIIIGYGLSGRTLSKVLKEADIPYVVLDLNIKTVRNMSKRNEPIYYGDATSTEILQSLEINKAKVLVIAINAPGSVRGIVEAAKRENPGIYIIVRTRYVMEVDELRDIGANEVIPEEFEVSIEIFARVLHHYQVPYNAITEMVELVRKESYQSLRGVDLGGKQLFAACETFPCEIFPDITVESYAITADSKLKDTTLRDINLRAKTGATIIAVRRMERLLSNPGANFSIKPGDILFLTGDMDAIKKAFQFFEAHTKKVNPQE